MTKQDKQPDQEQNFQDIQEKLASLEDQLGHYDVFKAKFFRDGRAPTNMIFVSLELLTNEYSEGLTDTQI